MPAAPRGGGGSVRSETRPSSHNKGGRARAAGGRPAPEAEVAERWVEAGGGGETGSREDRAGAAREEGRAGEGRRAPPGALPAPATAASPAAVPRAAAPQPARQLATSPGLHGAQGRGGGGRDQSARGSRAPSPQHASRPG